MRAAVSDLRRLGLSLLEAAGAPPPHAALVVDHLLEAEARGLRSHGIMRLPQYLAEIADGGIDPSGSPIVSFGKPGRATVDGGQTFGQVVGMRMAEIAVDLARTSGIGLVVGRRMGHTGRIGAYPERIAESGLVGMAFCSGAPSGHWVAPFGGREGRLATNPIAFAYPVHADSPVVADFSTAAVAEGAVRNFRNRGLQVPAGWLRDTDGQMTTDPQVLYNSPRGAIQPFGGELGYRGTALALLVEVLASLLAGDRVDDYGRSGSNLAIIALEVDDAFPAFSEGLGRHIRSSSPIVAARPVLMPGDRERESQKGSSGTVELDMPVWSALADAATTAGIAHLTEQS